ncbi:MAG: cytochrome c biogenesis protein CcsA [Euryarchaeota archaeon]|nr:cytochrome c biogenesis protein CcsA [Euryarchaeota archaeon]
MHPFATTYSAMEGYAHESGLPIEDILGYYRSSGAYTPGEGFVEGTGTNPYLASPWMALHPPVVFIAYGTITAVAAFLLAFFLRGSGDWKATALFWNRVSWLFLSFGILVGGIWAYEELTYGGYWVWDPVETSSLIPWLTLTAFLHSARQPGHRLLSPVLGVFTFVFVVYCTYITRSGILKSVHGYSETSVGPVLIYSILALAGCPDPPPGGPAPLPPGHGEGHKAPEKHHLPTGGAPPGPLRGPPLRPHQAGLHRPLRR